MIIKGTEKMKLCLQSDLLEYCLLFENQDLLNPLVVIKKNTQNKISPLKK